MLTRSRGLGGSPAVYGNRHRGAMTAAPAAARCIPLPPGRVANTAGNSKALLGRSMSSKEGKWRWFLAASNKRKRCLSHDVSTIPGRGKRRADERNARGKLQNWIQAPSRKLHRTFSCWPELQDTETPHPELSAGDIRLLSGKIAECCPACYTVLVNGGCRLLSKGGTLW